MFHNRSLLVLLRFVDPLDCLIDLLRRLLNLECSMLVCLVVLEVELPELLEFLESSGLL